MLISRMKTEKFNPCCFNFRVTAHPFKVTSDLFGVFWGLCLYGLILAGGVSGSGVTGGSSRTVAWCHARRMGRLLPLIGVLRAGSVQGGPQEHTIHSITPASLASHSPLPSLPPPYPAAWPKLPGFYWVGLSSILLDTGHSHRPLHYTHSFFPFFSFLFFAFFPFLSFSTTTPS